MFNVLNRFISALDSAPQDADRSSVTHDAYGFQVLRNTNEDIPLEPWFDFIIGINGRTMASPDATHFAAEIHNCAGKSVSLGVFCAKGQNIREIYLTVPSRPQSPTPGPPWLGISLQWSPLSLAEDVWHILDVIANSPADVAGLLPYGDYVIGSPEGLVRGEGGLGELVDEFLDRPLRLTVYNHEYNVTRPVTITPTRTWGGEGALGCVLGFGALHRIPASLDEPLHAPGETLFSSDAAPAQCDEKRPLTGGDFLVPADMPIAPTTNAGKKKGRAGHAGAAGNSALDDYFAEGAKKSAQEDVAASKGRGVPPPPKAGGPALEAAQKGSATAEAAGNAEAGGAAPSEGGE